MFRFISYIKFLFSATNQHGVHSPFVYDYVTKCLYTRKQLKLPISLKILVKSIDYFKYHSIRILNNEDNIEETIQQYCPNVSFTKNVSDVLVGSISHLNMAIEVNNLPNDSMLFLDGIHKNPNNHKSWKKLKALEHVKVTVDLFYCGVIFFRKEQAKEHFKIRI